MLRELVICDDGVVAMTSEIEIKIGPVELTCRGDVDAEQLDGVLSSCLLYTSDAADE